MAGLGLISHNTTWSNMKSNCKVITYIICHLLYCFIHGDTCPFLFISTPIRFIMEAMRYYQSKRHKL